MEEVAALTLGSNISGDTSRIPGTVSCGGSQSERLRSWRHVALALQVNARTLMRWSTRRLGLELLRETSCPLLASDCHNLTSRPPNLAEARKVLQQKMERNSAQIDKKCRRCPLCCGRKGSDQSIWSSVSPVPDTEAALCRSSQACSAYAQPPSAAPARTIPPAAFNTSRRLIRFRPDPLMALPFLPQHKGHLRHFYRSVPKNPLPSFVEGPCVLLQGLAGGW